MTLITAYTTSSEIDVKLRTEIRIITLPPFEAVPQESIQPYVADRRQSIGAYWTMRRSRTSRGCRCCCSFLHALPIDGVGDACRLDPVFWSQPELFGAARLLDF